MLQCDMYLRPFEMDALLSYPTACKVRSIVLFLNQVRTVEVRDLTILNLNIGSLP